MPNIKTIKAHYTTGATLHATVRREADGYFLDDADGTFGASPADPWVALTEDGTALGEYALDESRMAWDDGRYTIAIREQDGGSPAWSDTVVRQGEMVIRDDSEVTLDASTSFVHKWVLNRLTVTDNGGGTKTVTLYDDDGTTPLKTWPWDPATKTRGAAT